MNAKQTDTYSRKAPNNQWIRDQAERTRLRRIREQQEQEGKQP